MVQTVLILLRRLDATRYETEVTRLEGVRYRIGGVGHVFDIPFFFESGHSFRGATMSPFALRHTVRHPASNRCSRASRIERSHALRSRCPTDE